MDTGVIAKTTNVYREFTAASRFLVDTGASKLKARTIVTLCHGFGARNSAGNDPLVEKRTTCFTLCTPWSPVVLGVDNAPSGLVDGGAALIGDLVVPRSP